MLGQREYPPSIQIESSFLGLNLGQHTMTSMRKNKNMRRFNDEQTKLLETMFEAESRPESRMKQQLANAVGLRPRQVAIWFQNRRARLKTKQIERDYYMLKASYDTLASNMESLKKEKQSLLLQLQKLKVLLGKPHGNKNGNSSDVRPVQIDPTSESKEKPSLLSGSVNHKTNIANIGDVECCGPCGEETGILNIEEPTDDSLTSSGDWCSFNCSGFLDQSSGSSNWWEFLS